MGRFTNAAKQATGNSPVIAGHDKIGTDELILKHPDHVTVTKVDIINKSNGEWYPVCNYAEDPTKYFNGGIMMANIVNEWIALCNGSLESVNEGLTEEGGVAFVVTKKHTKTGKTVVCFDPID